MKIAIDCRMIGSGGIGSYISALLPYFINRYKCVLLGNKKDLETYNILRKQKGDVSMKNVNNRNELVEILSNLDIMEFIPVKIQNSTMDLFYDVEIDKFVVFDRCEWIFDTLDEVEEYIVEEYQL